MTIYGEKHVGNEIIALAGHDDGRVGIWSVTRQQWIEVYGNGENQAGFINELNKLDSRCLKEDGLRVLRSHGAKI